ncbi:MAG: T9SS type A sorting domain-containing protein [Candidatus Muiribacteriota bacterium]
MKRVIIFFFIINFLILTYSTSLIRERIEFERQHVRNRNINTVPSTPDYGVGDVKSFWKLNSQNSYELIHAMCTFAGEQAYIFHDINIDFIDDNYLDKLLTKFEQQNGFMERLQNKFSKNSTPAHHGGGKIIILITDLGDFSSPEYGSFKDQQQYDDSGNPVNPAEAYFSPLDYLSSDDFEYSNESRIIYLNSYLFNYFEETDGGFNPVYNLLSREYFRMLHFTMGIIENQTAGYEPEIPPLWMDYGLAAYAEMVATGKFNISYLNSLASNPENSVNIFEHSFGMFGISRKDLGKAALFFKYLDDNFGAGDNNEGLLGNIIHHHESGVQIIEDFISEEITKVFNDFNTAFFLNNPSISDRYYIKKVDVPSFLKSMKPEETEFNEKLIDFHVSPRIKLKNKPQLRMGGSIAYRIGERFWPSKYMYWEFVDLNPEDKINIRLFMYNKGEFVKEYEEININAENNTLKWSEPYLKGDELIIILSDVSNNLKLEGDYDPPLYINRSEEEYVDKLSDYVDFVGKKYNINFVLPEVSIGMYPSPFVPDYLHVNIHADGEAGGEVIYPSEDTEELEILKLPDTKYRHGSSFKIKETGNYRAEIKVSYPDGIEIKKEYLFNVAQYESGKNIHVDTPGGQVMLSAASQDKTKFFVHGSKDKIQIDTFEEVGFDAEIFFYKKEKSGIFMLDENEYKMLEFKEENNKLKADINKSGTYQLIQDKTPPDIKVDYLDKYFAKVQIQDKSPVETVVYNLEGKKIQHSSRKEFLIELQRADNEFKLESVDYFENKTKKVATAPRESATNIQNTQVYPNPASNFVNINFTTNSINPEIIIYESSGRRVRKINKGEFIKNGDNYRIIWPLDNNRGQPVSSGVYFYHIKLDGKVYFEGKISIIY